MPALRETDKVLAILAKQNTVIRDLNQHADTVVGDLAAHKNDVSDWVDQGAQHVARLGHRHERHLRRLAQAARLPRRAAPGDGRARPDRRQAGRRRSTRSPPTPTSSSASSTTSARSPTRRARRCSALGQAGQVGSQAVKAAGPDGRSSSTRSPRARPSSAKNLAIILEHLDDRKNTVEYDKRAAEQQGVKGPSGYSGLEALLQYVLDQATSTNIYDQSTHILAVMADEGGPCRTYKDYVTVRDNKALKDQCQAKTGPNCAGRRHAGRLGGDAPPRQSSTRRPRRRPAATSRARRRRPSATRTSSRSSRAGADAPKTPDKPKTPDLPKTPDVPKPPPVKIPDRARSCRATRPRPRCRRRPSCPARRPTRSRRRR